MLRKVCCGEPVFELNISLEISNLERASCVVNHHIEVSLYNPLRTSPLDDFMKRGVADLLPLWTHHNKMMKQIISNVGQRAITAELRASKSWKEPAWRIAEIETFKRLFILNQNRPTAQRS